MLTSYLNYQWRWKMEERKTNAPVTWRQQAKELGITLYHRKKEDVLAEIKTRLSEGPPRAEETIEPIPEHPEYVVGDLTPVEDLMGRIATLENRVNLLIMRFDRLVDAVSKSKRTKGI